MVDLRTSYLGIELNNPLVPSASPFSKDLDSAKRLEDAGASALVMHSLFEEKIDAEQHHAARFYYSQSLGHAEADSFHPLSDSAKSYADRYVEQLSQLKSNLSIPIIASLNGTSLGGWIAYGKELQQAGADALELNNYHIAASSEDSSEDVENLYINLLKELKHHVSVPITMKLSAQFSAPIHFAKRLEAAGADGLVLFNRFYQPDIDLETLHVVPKLELSTSAEALLRIRWTALLYGRVKTSLAVTGGFHSSADVLKALLAGADVVHVCSTLLQHGGSHLTTLLNELEQWLIVNEYESVAQLKGSVSYQYAIDPTAYQRANYVQLIDNYSPVDGVMM